MGKSTFAKIINQTAKGIAILPVSIGYIFSNPWIWIWILIPFILNVIIFIVLGLFFFNFFSNVFENYLNINFINSLPILETIFNVIFKTIFFIISYLISIYLVLSIGLMIASPFYTKLIEKILKSFQIKNINTMKGVSGVLKELYRSLKFEFGKILLSVFILIFTTFLNLIPVIGTILYILINFLFSGTVNLLDMYDIPLTMENYSFKNKIKYILKNFDKNFGMIVLNGFLIAIPFLNFFYIPFAMITTTLLFIDNKE